MYCEKANYSSISIKDTCIDLYWKIQGSNLQKQRSRLVLFCCAVVYLKPALSVWTLLLWNTPESCESAAMKGGYQASEWSCSWAMADRCLCIDRKQTRTYLNSNIEFHSHNTLGRFIGLLLFIKMVQICGKDKNKWEACMYKYTSKKNRRGPWLGSTDQKNGLDGFMQEGRDTSSFAVHISCLITEVLYNKVQIVNMNLCIRYPELTIDIFTAFIRSY